MRDDKSPPYGYPGSQNKKRTETAHQLSFPFARNERRDPLGDRRRETRDLLDGLRHRAVHGRVVVSAILIILATDPVICSTWSSSAFTPIERGLDPRQQRDDLSVHVSEMLVARPKTPARRSSMYSSPAPKSRKKTPMQMSMMASAFHCIPCPLYLFGRKRHRIYHRRFLPFFRRSPVLAAHPVVELIVPATITWSASYTTAV